MVGNNSSSFYKGASTSIIAGLGPSDILPLANGGTGTNSPSLVAGLNVGITGSWPNQTVSCIIPSTRTLLQEDTTFFVRTDGNDSNDGLTNSPSGAFLTLSGALNKLASSYDFGGYTVRIRLIDGTYNNTFAIIPVMVGNKGPTGLVIEGNPDNSENVVIDGDASSQGAGTIFASVAGACCTIKNLKLTTNFPATAHLNAQSGGQIYFSNLILGQPEWRGFAVYVFGSGSYISNLDETLTFRGSQIDVFEAKAVFEAQTGGVIGLYGGTWNTTIENTIYGGAFARATAGGIIDTVGCNFGGSGSFTGKRFEASEGGIIRTYGSGLDYFPGTVAGTPTTLLDGSYS